MSTSSLTSGHSQRGHHPNFPFDPEWLELQREEVLDPDLPIIDSHHHLWDRGQPYWLPQLLEDATSGHNIRASVFVEARCMYRAGASGLNPALGEIEFANGMGAAFASGYHGDIRLCAGIVGRTDLSAGEAVEDFLIAAISRAPTRFRGIRQTTSFDPDPAASIPSTPVRPGMMREAAFKQGLARLGRFGLSFDTLCYHPQLPELIELVDSAPDTRVIVNHCGMPMGEGKFAGRRDEVFADWSASMRELAKRPNVYVKLGGLGGRIAGNAFIDRDHPPSSTELAAAWAPYFDLCIEAFGTDRAMFESNFPPEKCCTSMVVLWNAFKRCTNGASKEERHQLFFDTARRAYRLEL